MLTRQDLFFNIHMNFVDRVDECQYLTFKEMKLSLRQRENIVLYRDERFSTITNYFCTIEKRLFAFHGKDNSSNVYFNDYLKEYGWYLCLRDIERKKRNYHDRFCFSSKRWKNRIKLRQITEISKLESVINSLNYLYNEKFFDVRFINKKFNKHMKIYQWIYKNRNSRKGH